MFITISLIFLMIAIINLLKDNYKITNLSVLLSVYFILFEVV